MYRFFAVKTRQQLVLLAVFALATSSIFGRDVVSKVPTTRTIPLSSYENPVIQYSAHSRGNMQLIIGNNGTFGTEGTAKEDPFTGEQITSCVYPKYSDLVYLWVAALWVGAVVGRDTAVSCGNEDWYNTKEFWPTESWRGQYEHKGGFQYLTIDPSNAYYSDDAYSEQDIICMYDDTRTDVSIVGVDPFDNLPHRPLGIEVTQRSMAWSYDYADDFILFDYKVENIGTERLTDVYMGIWIDGDVWHVLNKDANHWTDDIVGFKHTWDVDEVCPYTDTINIAYHADNDGDPTSGAWDAMSVRPILGVKVVRTPSDSLSYSYNWWVWNFSDGSRDWGPRRAGTEEDPFRDFDYSLGSPRGDKNKYYILRHQEFDYDLLFTAVDHTQEGWLSPPEGADNYADGFDVRNLLSFGPFDIEPGEVLPITFAWVGGEDFHVGPTDFDDNWDPYQPTRYYNKLDFSSVVENARWASWIYDNPGVDTDGNGYRGKYRTCCTDTVMTDTGIVYQGCDTTFYEGDGVPDFRGASPPPPPEFWLHPSVGSIKVRFNGRLSEITGDHFTGDLDFEGYRVYIGRDERATSYSLVASYDREDFTKFVYNATYDAWEVFDTPFSLEQLQQLYGDPIGQPEFDPLAYTRVSPYQHPYSPDSLFFFVRQDFNQSEFGVTTPIRKIYPDQPYPSSLYPELAEEDELTEDGYLKYFEYEMEIDNLLPTIPYYVNITAFDFGSPEVGLGAMESSITIGAQTAYPLTAVDEVEEQNLKVYVYPNPYRADQNYDGDGFENRDGTEAASRMRRLHFANLPRVCKIYIYSLDGDLVRELDHNYPDGGPEAMHDTWNLITRNTQAAVSGLYYWVVESEHGTQMGKFVIIR
ncbi:MAG: hypothetical protein AB1483_07870 [Candidatus Zixiibacteriota bacterium]